MGPRRALYIAPLSDAPTWNQPSIMSRSPSHAPSAPTSARTSSSSAQPLTPPEDLRRGVRPDVVERATPMLRQLMALEYPYPEILDDNTGEATIGRDVEADSHSAVDA